MVNKNLLNRFLNYIKFDTQSSDESNTTPTTMKQKELGSFLVSEMKNIGISNAYMDEYGYVYGYIPSKNGSEKTIGLIAHMDTALDASGANVNAKLVENYQGVDIKLNDKTFLSPVEFPELIKSIGHTLVTTDGTTLLGADDKAGIAIIMTVADAVINSYENYPNIIVCFTPDEEVGQGTDHINLNYFTEKNCNIAYTVDGGDISDINFENFNAASAFVTVHGKSIHTGSAYGIMINSALVAMEFNNMIDPNMVPSKTRNRQGFYHLNGIDGDVTLTKMNYLIRNHDLQAFEQQKEDLYKYAKIINDKYGDGVLELVIKDTYHNMKELVSTKPFIVDFAKQAVKENGINPISTPIRGGTDGAELSYKGILTPNLGTGGANCHGVYEYLDADNASLMVLIIETLLKKYY